MEIAEDLYQKGTFTSLFYQPLTSISVAANILAILFQSSSVPALYSLPHPSSRPRSYLIGFISYPRTETTEFDPATDIHALVRMYENDNKYGAFATRILNGEYEVWITSLSTWS